MTTPAPTVWTTLSFSDARAGIAFLVEGLGFTEHAVYADDADSSVVHHAELLWPHGGGVMCGSARDGSPVTRPGGASAYCVVTSADEVDRIHARALTRGGVSVRAPNDPEHGGRECTLRDPEGNHWSIGTYPGAAS
jgi:uncharacterized glyoxalase superfamily protein PhnB